MSKAGQGNPSVGFPCLARQFKKASLVDLKALYKPDQLSHQMFLTAPNSSLTQSLLNQSAWRCE